MFQKVPGLKVWVVATIVTVCTTLGFGQNGQPATFSASMQDQLTTNSCSAGEPVVLNGVMNYQYSVASNPTGGNTFTISVANNLNGVGQNTTGNYVANDSADYLVNSSQSSTEATVEFKSELTSQGSAPTMTLIQTLDIVVDTNGNLSAQVIGNTTQCGN
jgi:hypothetical protein